jgi:hypothetical protein
MHVRGLYNPSFMCCGSASLEQGALCLLARKRKELEFLQQSLKSDQNDKLVEGFASLLNDLWS